MASLLGLTACNGVVIPTKPVDPTTPSQPSQPSEPTVPTEPSVPSEPTTPSEPSVPTYQVKLDKEELSMVVGAIDELKASIENLELELTFQWESSNPDVVAVNNGELSAVAAGEAVITVYVDIEGTRYSASCKVTVTEPTGDYFINEATEITFSCTFNDTYGEILKGAIENLKKKEPFIKVNYVKYNGSYTALKDDVVKNINTNNHPDMVVAYPDSVADFITANAQLKMDRFMNDEDYGWTDEEKEDFIPAYIEEGQHYNIPGTYSLPIAKSTEGMYYDYDKIVGLSLANIDPTINNGNALTEEYLNNLTWEELFNKLCPALLAYRETLGSEELKKAFLDTETQSDWALVGYDSDDNLFITLAEQYGYGYTDLDTVTGKGIINFNNDGMKNLMKVFNAAYKNKYFTTKGIIGTNVNYRSTADQMLFSIGSTGGANYQFSATNPKNVRVARVPHAENGNDHQIQQGPSVAFLTHKDENRALASWLLYKEMTTTNICTKWSTTTGYSPIRESVLFSDDYLDFSDDTLMEDKSLDKLKAFNAQYINECSDILFSSPVFKGSSEARTQVGGLATEAISLENMTDEALNGLFQKAYENTVMKM